MTVVVVGAGIAGLACARALADGGVAVRVLEREPEVGGRLASLRRGGRPVDVGAAYLTADDPAFAGRLQSWRIAGLAHPWTDTFRGQHGAGPMRWSAPDGLRSLAVDLARGLDVTVNAEIRSLDEVAGARAVVLAMPGPQALQITDLGPARRQIWSPVVTAILSYGERVWPDFGGAFINDHPALATICDDGDRRGDGAPVLVAHSTTAFASDPPDDPGAVLAAATGEVLGIAAPPAVEIVRWPHAQPAVAHAQPAVEHAQPAVAHAQPAVEHAQPAVAHAQPVVKHGEPSPRHSALSTPSPQPAPPADSPDGHIGNVGFARVGDVYLCGDAFGRPRVQTAWLSGRAVAHDLLKRGGR